jgi:alginate O-acetyltransferase complex protein AlgI
VLFNSFPFLYLFLPAVAVGYYAVPRHRLRLLLLVLASYYFYAYADWWFPALMAGSTAISFTGGRLLESPRLAERRKLVLGLGIAGVLALLGYYKYTSFVGGYALSFVHVITQRSFPGLHAFVNSIALPIGISFYTFEGISYMVDVYRGKLRAERDLLRYSFFISFFPHLIAGPIVRYGILQPQLMRKHRFDPDLARSGLMLFTLGLAKKVLLADALANWVDHYLATPDSIGLANAWASAIGFGFQIYFDFSAYSDMALGLARIFGIELPWNFDRPYRSASPTEFWRRWHVTLSSWLRDYLYIPLGGNRKGERRRDVNLLVTMGLGGLWHGASLNFVAWGLYHGGLLLGTHHAQRRGLRLQRVFAVAATFFLVVVGWVLFRMHSAADIGGVYAGMLGLHGFGGVPGHLVLYLLVSAAIVWGLPEEWRWPVATWGAVRVAAVAVLFVVSAASVYTSHPFIYFRF